LLNSYWRPVTILALICSLGLIVGIMAALGAAGMLGSKQTASQVVLQKLVSKDDFRAATATYEVRAEITDRSILPSFLAGMTSILHGTGSDSAFVSFESLTNASIIMPGPNSLTIILPQPFIAPANLLVAKCYITSHRGIFTTISQIISYNPDAAKPLYLLAEAEIHAAAEHGQLTVEAERNTRAFLIRFLGEFHFRKINIRFI
jgi:hypothetical protein